MEVNYIPVIRKHTWWRSTNNRFFLVAEVLGDTEWAEPTRSMGFKPTRVGLVPYLSDQIIYRTWHEMVDAIETGKLSDITKY